MEPGGGIPGCRIACGYGEAGYRVRNTKGVVTSVAGIGRAVSHRGRSPATEGCLWNPGGMSPTRAATAYAESIRKTPLPRWLVTGGGASAGTGLRRLRPNSGVRKEWRWTRSGTCGPAIAVNVAGTIGRPARDFRHEEGSIPDPRRGPRQGAGLPAGRAAPVLG